MKIQYDKPGYVNIRGTNGTGKTTLIKRFIPEGAELKFFEDIGCYYYDCGTHFVVGRYDTATGGLDAVRGTYDEKTGTGLRSFAAGQEAIKRLAVQKLTFAEGLIMSGVHKGSMEVIDHLHAQNVPVVWLTIEVPMEVAFESVLMRRVKRGDLRPLKTDAVANKTSGVASAHNKAMLSASRLLKVVRVTREHAFPTIELLLSGRTFDEAKAVLPPDLYTPTDLEATKKAAKQWVAKEFVTPPDDMVAQHMPTQAELEAKKPAPAAKVEAPKTTRTLGAFFKK